MKPKILSSLLFLITSTFMYSKPINLSSLPFENTDITIEKIMAGIMVLFVYFIPTIISWNKKNGKFVLIVNLLMAWTVVGWFISFLWALKISRESESAKNVVKKKKKKVKIEA